MITQKIKTMMSEVDKHISKKERLQTKSWVVENFMKSYTLETNK